MNPDESPSPPEGTIEWCLGLPLTSHRPFDADEVTALTEESRRLGANGCLWGSAAPISFLIPLIIVSGIVNRLDKASPLVSVMSAALLLIIVPAAFLFLRSRDARRRSRDMRSDLRAGYVKCFRGPRAAFRGYALLATQNLETGELAATNSTDEVAIEVLPQSRRLWKVDGRNLPNWVLVGWTAVAPPPASAATVAAWVEPWRVPDPQVTGAGSSAPLQPEQQGRRDLSAAEKAELGPRIKKLWLRPLWPALFFNLWMGGSWLGTAASGAKITLDPMVFLALGMLVFANLTLFRAIKHASLLRQDLSNGYVVVLRLANGARSEPQALETRPGATSGTVVELLPLSKWLWTRAGAPAPWRKLAVD